MSIDAAWKCLSVEDFISKCNWENLVSQLPNNSTAVKPQNLLLSWQCLTSQDFFSLNNWSGQVIYSDNLQQADFVEQAVVFDLTFNVEQFWQCFNWSGEFNLTEKIDPVDPDKIIEDTEEIIAVAEEFTLNDLSQLF